VENSEKLKLLSWFCCSAPIFPKLSFLSPKKSKETEVSEPPQVSEVKEKMEWFKNNPMFTGPNIKGRWWSRCIPKMSDLSGSQVEVPVAVGAVADAAVADAAHAAVGAVEDEVVDPPGRLDTSEKAPLKYRVSALLKHALILFSTCNKAPLKKSLVLQTIQEDNRPVITLRDPENTELAPEVVIVLESLHELESPKEKVPEESQ